MKYIPLSVPNLRGNEMEYVTRAVTTEWVSTSGSFVNEFEGKMAEYVGSEGAVACQSGTSGLHVALLVSGVTGEDEVIAPTLTFIAAVNPIRYINAQPVFMDCDDSLCIDPVKLERFCREECTFIDGKLKNRLTGRHIKAIVVVHVFGNLADMEAIMDISSRYNMKVIEDSTEALGTYYTQGKYKRKFAGAIGDIGVYSFNGNKIITTGGGGMIVSNDLLALNRARSLTTQAKKDELNFIHDEVGYNYRMTNVQAAIGLAQLEQLEKFIDIKEENYNRYYDKIKKIQGIKMLAFRKGTRPNKWFYSVLCEDEYLRTKNELIDHMSENSVQARPIWGLISEQKPYKDSQEYLIEKAKYYWERIVNIPCSTNLSNNDVDRVIDLLSIIKGDCIGDKRFVNK